MKVEVKSKFKPIEKPIILRNCDRNQENVNYFSESVFSTKKEVYNNT